VAKEFDLFRETPGVRLGEIDVGGGESREAAVLLHELDYPPDVKPGARNMGTTPSTAFHKDNPWRALSASSRMAAANWAVSRIDVGSLSTDRLRLGLANG